MCREEFSKITVVKGGIAIGEISPPPLSKKKEEELNTPLPAPYNDTSCECCGLATQGDR